MILAPRPGIKPAPLALEGKHLTTGLPEKSLWFISVSPELRTGQALSKHLLN